MYAIRSYYDQGQPLPPPPVLKGRERRMASESHPVEVVHAGPPERAVGDREAGRLDDMRNNFV